MRVLLLYLNLLAHFGISVVTASERVYVSEDFEHGHDAGHAPAWSVTAYHPLEEDQTEKTHLVIVEAAQNSAGTGKGLMLSDFDTTQARFAYDFTENKQFQVSTFRFRFDFAWIEGVTGGAEVKVAAGEHGSTFNGKDRRFASAALTAEGEFVLTDGDREIRRDISQGRHRLEMYVNDLEQSFSYTCPGGRSARLKANSADWYLDGKLVGSNSLFPAKTEGSIDNFGRAGIMTGKNEKGVCYVFDHFEIADLDPVPRAIDPGRSQLAYREQGRLHYGKYANEGQQEKVHQLPDFSRAGYRGGGVAIPFVPAVITLQPSGGDDTQSIQQALKKIGRMPLSKSGFRGALLLRSGTYHLQDTIHFDSSGIVLRGEGAGKQNGTTLLFSSDRQMDCIRMEGQGDYREDRDSQTRIKDVMVPVGADSFEVADASSYRIGDRILIYNRYNQHWIDVLEMAQYGWTVKGYARIRNPRCITDIKGARIFIDAPICNPIEEPFGGGEIVKYTHERRLENTGIENLRIEAAYSYPLRDEIPWIGVVVRNCENFWIRQVTGQYIGKSLVDIGQGVHFGTVEDCAMLDYRGIVRGGGRYGFCIDDANYILFQRCYARHGRHDFIVNSRCPGPNVFLDCGSEKAVSDIGPHGRWSMGFLWDNVKGQRIQVPNRHATGTGHGWSGAQHLFWNCESTVMMCDAPIGAMNWSVGCYSAKIEGKVLESPFGIWDSHQVPVAPRSLYCAQLRDRLGNEAVKNVILPAQAQGRIWDSLFQWAGEGRFGPPLIAWATVHPKHPSRYQLQAIIRNLKMKDIGTHFQWSKVTGPGEVRFSEPHAADTEATFTQSGMYTIHVSAEADSIRAEYQLRVTVAK
ncbi:MAG: hypothetical protein AAGH72_09055 [Verrucomicrobiota bacterium]